MRRASDVHDQPVEVFKTEGRSVSLKRGELRKQQNEFLMAQLAYWMGIGASSAESAETFCSALEDGVRLCELLRNIEGSGVVASTRLHKPVKNKMQALENIATFTAACERLGLHSVMHASHLEHRDMDGILACLLDLARCASEREMPEAENLLPASLVQHLNEVHGAPAGHHDEDGDGDDERETISSSAHWFFGTSRGCALLATFAALSQRTKAIVAVLSFQLVCSVWNLCAGPTMDGAGSTTPLGILLIRQVGTGIVVGALALRYEVHGVGWRTPRIEDIGRAAICGLIAIFGVQITYLYGVLMTSPTTASLFDGPLVPVGVFALSLAMGVENLAPHRRERALQLGSVALSVSGASIVLLLGASDSGDAEVRFGGISSSSYGGVIMSMETLFMVLGLWLQKALLDRLPPYTLLSVMYGAACVVMFALLSATHPGGAVAALVGGLAQMTRNSAFCAGVLYMVLVHSVAGMSLFNYGAKRLEASAVSMIAATQPIITMVLEWIFLSHTPTVAQVLGSAMVCLGLHWRDLADKKAALRTGMGGDSVKHGSV